MISNVYVLQDALTLETGDLMVLSSDKVLVRLLDNAAKSPALESMPNVPDIIAYRIGTYNSETMHIDGDAPHPVYKMATALAKARLDKAGDDIET